MKIFFNFVKVIYDEAFLNEDISVIHEYFKSIMHKFIFKFGDVDLEIIGNINEGLLLFYGFLCDKKTHI